MTSPSLLCRVQALYPFESDDPSSLTFEEGDYIDVLSKLPSGWWDGWCNGSRGWFPSNYVKVIDDYGVTVTETTKNTIQRRISAELFDDRVGVSESDSNKRASLPPNWSIQIRNDGSASYYFNTLTGEMRSTYPCDDEVSFYEGDSDEDSSTINSNLSRSDSSSDNLFSQQKWIQRTTPQGLPFFYNLSTNETAWHADSQEQQGSSPQIQPRVINTVQPSPPIDTKETLTWTKISLHITLTINNLIASAKNGQRSLYKRYATSAVEAIRFMLIASGTISKESPHIKSYNILRSHHRTMMASMSKLVLSVQLCADGTVTDVTKLLSDCHELLASIRNFINSCETIPIPVQYVNPTLLVDVPQTRRPSNTMSDPLTDHHLRAKYELQPDLIENLDAYGASMQESMESLMSNLTRHSDSRCSLAVLLFTQYRNFGNQNGQFLSIIEDIDFESVIHSPCMKNLASAKQKLYDGLGLLFYKMQTMTDETVPMDSVIKEMQEAAGVIIHAIQLVCESMAGLVAEKALLKKDSSTETFSDFLMEANKNASLDRVSVDKKESIYRLGNRSQPVSPTSQATTTKANRASAPVAESIDKNRVEMMPSKHTSAKLKQFFGDDLPEQPTSPTDPAIGARKSSTTPSMATSHHTTTSQEEEPRYLQYDYGPNEIVFTVEGSVKGGTLRALVERMTLHDYLDMNFNSTFLLTYRSFCTSMELLELLEARYNLQPPEELLTCPPELETWVNKKQKLIRLRVFNVLKIWLEQYYYEEDSVILDRLLFFTNTSIKDTLSFSAYQLERLIHKRKEACTDLKKLVITQPQDSPEPILPRNLKKFKLLDVDALEMARQLTLMDFKMYSAIKPVECLDKAWSRDVAVNIQASIDYCNRVTTWVSDEILSQSEVKKRSAIIKYWVSVADKCRSFNNFNTCMAILSAFDNSAVGRLKRTWEMVGARTNHVVAQMRKIMGANRNFGNYRGIIHSVNPPCIPFLGIYLQDLTFIEDGNPNFLKTSKDLINFAKRAKTAEVIREMQQYQTIGYQFRPVDEIHHFITENLHSSRDEDQLYRESLKLEPKERDDEKIARLLQESGFL